MESGKKLKPGEHLVRISLQTIGDTFPNYKLDMYEMDSTGLAFTATTGVHYIDTTGNKNRTDIFRYCLQAIVRYSFK
jgi:hypothetical protein